MSEAVLDASVVLKWFHREDESHLEAARTLRARFEAGELRVLAPPLLWLEVMNVAARAWGWEVARLEEFATTLLGLRFQIAEPELAAVARWTGRGLTAYDAAYVALAEQAGTQVITDDAELVHRAPGLAVPLAAQVSEADQERDADPDAR